MPILKLMPCCKDYLWGGSKLKTMFHKRYDGAVLAETWELSCHKDGESSISGGPFNGMPLSDYIRLHGRCFLGTNCDRFKDFPVLVKLIDAKEKLSVQVHPDDAYALETEGQYGKTEMWYVADAEESAFIYYGFTRDISGDEFRQRIEQDTLLEVLQSVRVKKGDVVFIPAGTIHAIGGGIVIAEIQQNSNLTYRVYDYGRLGPDGKSRQLHIDKALDVTCLHPRTITYDFGTHLGSCSYFMVDMIEADIWYSAHASEKSFHHLLILDGEGVLFDHSDRVSFQRGDSLYICAGTGSYTIVGKCRALQTTIPEQ